MGVPSTRVARAYSSSIKLDLYFWAQVLDNFVKIYTFVKIRPTVIEILAFNKWSSKFYFPEACKRQTAIKTGKPLAHCKRSSHNYGTNIALPGTMQILLFGAGYKYSYLLTYLVEYSSTRQDIWQSTRAVKSSIHTPLHIIRHLEFIIEQGNRVNWVSGSLDSRVTGSLRNKMWPSSMSAPHC